MYTPEILGLATVLGLVAFFGLVGHDEQTRHLVQSLPFVIFFFHPKLLSQSTITGRANMDNHPAPKLRPGFLETSIAILILVALALANELQDKSHFLFIGGCEAADSTPRPFKSVAEKLLLDGTAETFGSGWVADAFAELPPSVLLLAEEDHRQHLELLNLMTEDVKPLKEYYQGFLIPRLCAIYDAPPPLETLGIRGFRLVSEN